MWEWQPPLTRICLHPERSSPAAAGEVPVCLSDTHAYAVAELLQVLACGEESAALAFDYLANASRASWLRVAFAGIADDEREHQNVICSLRRSLPPPAADAAFQRLIRVFFLTLADRDILVHCVRIVAIDSALCLLLGALRARGGPIAAESTLSTVLSRIHRDEARHVGIAKRGAGPLLATLPGRDIAAEARDRLVRVLEHRAPAFDALMVDPDRLFAQLRRAGRNRKEA